MDSLLAYLEHHEGPLAYFVLAVAAALEYIFPPFPGDTVTLFGTFLAMTAGYHGWILYISMTLGAVAGGLLAYGFGRWLKEREARWPRFLQGQRVHTAITTLQDRFTKRGAVYLVANRFVPAFRAFFFVAAGLARMPILQVVLYSTISAALWNALIFSVGYALGRNWEQLLGMLRQYTLASVAFVGFLGILFALRWYLRTRSSRAT